MQHALHVVTALGKGRFSLHLVIVASLLLAWSVILLAFYMVAFRAYHRLRARYRNSRAALYRPAIELVLMEEPYERVLETLRPRRWGDADVVQEVMIESMRHLAGPPFETLRRCALDLGLVAQDIATLRSGGRHRRGRAMEALGIMHSREGVPGLVAALDKEPLDLRLVALRALAAIGDESALPAFVAQADRVPRPLLPRLISLTFEFQEPGRRAAAEIINKYPQALPPAAVRDILLQFAADYETAP